MARVANTGVPYPVRSANVEIPTPSSGPPLLRASACRLRNSSKSKCSTAASSDST